MHTGGNLSAHTYIRTGNSTVFALLTLVRDLINRTIQLQIDNKSEVAYINHMGGTHSEILNSIAKEIWNGQFRETFTWQQFTYQEKKMSKQIFFEQALPRSDGMKAESASISRNCSRSISSSGRLVRQSFELSAPKVCVLPTRSNSMKNGCSLNTMEKSKSLCFPAIQPNTTISSESETRQSPNNLSNSLLDNTTLVP